MAGLTNTPAFDLVAVAASTLLPSPQTIGFPMDAILAALGLPAGASEAAVLAAIAKLKSGVADIAKVAGLPDTAAPADVQVAVAAAFSASATPDPTKFVPIAAVTTLQAQFNTMQASLVDDKAEQAVASAIKDGKLVPALREWGLKQFKADPALFATFVGSAPVLLPTQIAPPRRPEDGTPALSEADQAVCRALGIDSTRFVETRRLEEAR